jgi:hypothetical protein
VEQLQLAARQVTELEAKLALPPLQKSEVLSALRELFASLKLQKYLAAFELAHAEADDLRHLTGTSSALPLVLTLSLHAQNLNCAS